MIAWIPRAHGFMSALILVSLLAAAQLPAAAQEVRAFNVSSPDPASAIRAFGMQAGLQILASADDLKGKKLNAVNGDLPVDRALNRLLAGTGLDHRYVGERAVALVSGRPESGGSAPAAETTPASAPVGADNRYLRERDIAMVSDTHEIGGVLNSADTTPAAQTNANEDHRDSPMSAMAEIMVTAQRTSDALARRAEFEAPNLVNLMTTEEIRRLPDVNIGESIARVPGISIETDTGEARFINIRGLDADLNSTTFGGLRLPPTNNASPSGGGRAVAFDSIPVGFVGAITVTKSNLPEQDAEALGGTIDITPKTAPADGKPFANIRLGTGREPLRQTWVKDISGTVGGRFGGSGASHPLSIIFTGAYYADRRGVDDLEAAYQDAQPTVPDKALNALEQRRYQYDRKRHGYGIDIGYEPSDDSKYYIRYYDAGYSQTANRQRLLLSFGVNYVPGNVGIDPANPNGFIDNVTFDKTLRDLKEIIDSKVFAIGGTNDFNGMTLDYHIGYTKGTYHKPYDYNPDFRNPTLGVIRYDNTTNPDWPSYSVTGVAPADPSGYTLAGFNNSTSDSNDHELGIGVNLAIRTHLTNAANESVKLGLNARRRRRTAEGETFSYSSVPALALAQAISGGNLAYYNGLYQNGPQIDPGVLRLLYANGTNLGFVRNIAGDAQSSALQYANATENVSAAYAQYHFGFGPLGLIGGLRIERTDAKYASNALVTPPSGPQYLAPVSDGTAYTNYFPSLQARYEFRPDLIGRAALSSTIARPGFNQVNASTTINPGAGTVQTGNPKLKPTTATSLDFAIEKTLPHAGVVSLGLFDKEISDYIVAIQTTQTYPNNGLFAGFVGPAHVFTYGNVPKARVWGFEGNYIQRMRDILPGPFGGIGFSLNYTWVASRFNIRPGESAQLPSSSKNTANANLMFETESRNFSASLGAYYVSRDLFTVGGAAATDVWNQARLSLDFGSVYKLTSQLSLQFDVKNLSNTALKLTEGPGENRPVQREFYGRTYLVGFNYDF